LVLVPTTDSLIGNWFQKSCFESVSSNWQARNWPLCLNQGLWGDWYELEQGK